MLQMIAHPVYGPYVQIAQNKQITKNKFFFWLSDPLIISGLSSHLFYIGCMQPIT